MMAADDGALPMHEDLALACQLAEETATADIFPYPGDRHLFADSSRPDYGERAATPLTDCVLQLFRVAA